MAAPALREVESRFWRSIAADPCGYTFERALVALVAPSPSMSPAQCIEVYADAYFLRLRDALADDFPKLAQLVGKEQFDQLVRDYLKAHPSTEPSLRHLGRSIADFIRGREQMPAYLADLATLEWARVGAFDAPDAQPLRMAELQEIDPADWPGLTFRCVPSLEILAAAWPVHALWAGETAENLAQAQTRIRVWRDADWGVRHAPMDEREADAIRTMLDGGCFAEICQAFDDLDEANAAREAGALLLRWLEDGILARAD